MIALTDQQFDMVMTAVAAGKARHSARARRGTLATLCRRAGRGFGDADVGLAISASLRGLVQSAA
jgi:hypothetical protein